MFWRIVLFLVTLGIGSSVLLYVTPLHSAPGTREPAFFAKDTITVGWVGDMVPAKDALYNSSVFSFAANELQKPDLMIGNLEGTFAHEDRTSKCVYFSDRCHAFRGDTSFARALTGAGFDFVSLINNHSYDYGEDGLKDTLAVLDTYNIPYIAPTKPTTSITIKGKTIGIVGLSSTRPASTITDYEFITKNVSALRETNDFVIVIFHGGTEGSDKTLVPNTYEFMGTENRGNVAKVARTAIDAGADLVLGSGPHVLRKIEYYKDKLIAYSLGNFVGGNGLLQTHGTLGISAIFTTSLSPEIPAPYELTSVMLTPNGTPTIDLLDQGKKMLERLSQ